MAHTTNSTTAQINQFPIDFQLMRFLLSTAKSVSPYLVGTMPGRLEKNAGTASVKWERIENLAEATTPLGELQTDAIPTRESVTPTINNVTATIQKFGTHIRMTEELELMSVNARTTKFMKTLGENAGRSINGVARNTWGTEVTTEKWSGGTSTITVDSALTALDIEYAYNKLNREDAIRFRGEGHSSTNIDTRAIRSSYIGICHSDQEQDIRGRATFIPSEQYAGYTSMYIGEFGTLGGVRWISTSTAPINPNAGSPNAIANGLRTDNAANVNVYTSYIYGEEALGTVGLGENHTKEIYKTGERLPTIQVFQDAPGGTHDPLHEIYTLAWKSWFVGKLLQANWIVKIESGSKSL